MDKIDATPVLWAAPKNIHALTTTRSGGVSTGPYKSLNLGDRVGDAPEAVKQNRALILDALRLPTEPTWLKQVHGLNVVDAESAQTGITADGAFTNQRGVVCAILTADCLPIFLCDRRGTKVALLHAGWRGLAGGIIEAGVKAMNVRGVELLAHIGPGIGPGSYEVGDDVREAFEQQDPVAANAFLPRGKGHWLADMYELAHMRLRSLGVDDITLDEDACTYRDSEKYFSYRRDGVCGRMASLIWIE